MRSELRPDAPNDVLTLISAQIGRGARTPVGAGEAAPGGVTGFTGDGVAAKRRAQRRVALKSLTRGTLAGDSQDLAGAQAA